MLAKIIALYIRLSLDDGDLSANKTMSDSVQNQRTYLRNFLIDHPEVIEGEIKEFIDDGYTGTNMDRPAFAKMIKLVRSRQVVCVLVKDLSRLGRNYLEVGAYLEQIFPYMGVRFISIDDNYDSRCSKGDVLGMDVVFKNIIHDYYSKELSGKVIQTRSNLAKKGFFMGGIPPFGYIRDPKDKHKLIIDPDSAETVRKIYSFAMDGKSLADTARVLNREKVETPRQRLWRLGIRKKGLEEEQLQKSQWSVESVRAILRNPVVIGSVTNHRVERKVLGRAELKTVSKSKHIVVPDMHEAIIDKDIYEKVQNNCNVRRKNRYRREASLLSGVLTCMYCGRNLVKEGGRNKYYVCKYSRADEATGHKVLRIEEISIQKALAMIISVMVSLQVDVQKGIQKGKPASGLAYCKISKTSELKKKILSEAYEAYINGMIDKNIFLEQKRRIQQEFNDVSSMAIPESQAGVVRVQDQIKQVVESGDCSWLTRQLLQSLVQEIWVIDDTKIEIVWRCNDWFNT